MGRRERFSISKTTCVHFHKQRIYTEPTHHLDGQAIPVKDEVKFLGLVFDKKLDFKAHVAYLKKKCQKALNILRVVGHTDWGADKSTLLKLYRTLVRSKLDYGCAVYGSAKHDILKLLDPIHHQGLRIALGAFRTSPVQSLYAEAGEPSLRHRRLKLSMNYFLKLKSLPDITTLVTTSSTTRHRLSSLRGPKRFHLLEYYVRYLAIMLQERADE